MQSRDQTHCAHEIAKGARCGRAIPSTHSGRSTRPLVKHDRDDVQGKNDDDNDDLEYLRIIKEVPVNEYENDGECTKL